MDTPARAARASRPHTRAWKHMLSEAAEQSAEAATIRAKLRTHLAAADLLATKRQEKAKALAEKSLNKQQPEASLSSKQKPAQSQSTPQPVIHEHPLQILSSLSTEWTQRVSALMKLRTIPKVYDLDPVIPWLALQLSDLRSKVVSAASMAIEAVAAAGCLRAEQAGELFVSAALGTNVSKQVMADARRVAALAALHGQDDLELFGRVAESVCTASHAAGKRVALDGLVQVVGNAGGVDCVKEAVLKALGNAAVDRASEVRAGARLLKEKYESRFGADEWGRIVANLPSDAATRLNDGGQGVGSKVSQAKLKGRMTMKEMIRAKREALKKEKAATEGAETIGRKRSSSQLELSGRKDASKKGTFSRTGKENNPA